MEAEILQKLSEQDFEFKIHYTVNENTPNCLTFYLQGLWMVAGDFNIYGEASAEKTFEIYAASSFSDGIKWLVRKVIELYQESEFAKWWKEQQEKNNV